MAAMVGGTTGAAVTAVGDGFAEIGTERLEAGTILWAAGVAASPIARSLGVPLDRAGRVIPADLGCHARTLPAVV